LATLKILEDGRLIACLNKRGDKLRKQLKDVFERKDMDVHVTGLGSLWHTHFTKEPFQDSNAVALADNRKLTQYHMHLIENGVFFLPRKVGALCAEHSEADLERLLSETERFKI
jgi:glutamate-1-semialdehyde aminotransferase